MSHRGAGPLWFTCIEAKQERMTLCADWVVLAMETLAENSGFTAFERALVAGAARILPAYHQYYLDYLHTVQNPATISALEANPPPADRADLLSSYTAVTIEDGSGALVAAPIATHYASALAPVLAGFDAWIAACVSAGAAPQQAGEWSADDRAAYIAFLQQYRDCLASTAGPAGLEDAWTELDHKWMATKMPIQLVHDIETGYGDPVRPPGTLPPPFISSYQIDKSLWRSCAARRHRTCRCASSTTPLPKRTRRLRISSGA